MFVLNDKKILGIPSSPHLVEANAVIEASIQQYNCMVEHEFASERTLYHFSHLQPTPTILNHLHTLAIFKIGKHRTSSREKSPFRLSESSDESHRNGADC